MKRRRRTYSEFTSSLELWHGHACKLIVTKKKDPLIAVRVLQIRHGDGGESRVCDKLTGKEGKEGKEGLEGRGYGG